MFNKTYIYDTSHNSIHHMKICLKQIDILISFVDNIQYNCQTIF